MTPRERHQHTICRVIDSLHTAVLLLDEQLQVGYANPAAEMLFALSVRRIVGMPLHILIADEAINRAVAAVLESGHPFTERELNLHEPSEKRITVDMTVIPLFEPGEPREVLMEMSQVDRQLRITREEGLLAQSHTTRALIRGLAHEIKNPLGGLRGAAQLLEAELTEPELKEYTGIIISEADRLQGLMNRMLGPNALPQRRLINIHEVLERVRQLVRAEVPATTHLIRDYDPSIPELHADRDQLIQAILNLVRNATQILAGHGHVTLRTRAMRQYTIGHNRHKLVARIDVIDDGPGIAPQLREGIFLPLVTSRPDGTGLGLPIAQSLINANGGLIECDSRPGHTTFTVLIPIEVTNNGVNTPAAGVE